MGLPKVGLGVFGSKVLEAQGCQQHPNSNPVKADLFYTVTDKQNAPAEMPGMTLLTLRKETLVRVGELSEADQIAQQMAMNSALRTGKAQNELGHHNKNGEHSKNRALVGDYVNVDVAATVRAGQLRGCNTTVFGIVTELPPKIAFDVNGEYEIKILDGSTDTTQRILATADKITRATKCKVNDVEVYELPNVPGTKFGMQRVFVPSTGKTECHPGNWVKSVNRSTNCSSHSLSLANGGLPTTSRKTSGFFSSLADGVTSIANKFLRDGKKFRRRRVMERLLRYETHYSSGADGHPPKGPESLA